MAVERAGGAYLRGLRLDFTGTSEGSVDFTHDCGLELSFGCWFLSWVATKPRYSLELSFTFDTFFSLLDICPHCEWRELLERRITYLDVEGCRVVGREVSLFRRCAVGGRS